MCVTVTSVADVLGVAFLAVLSDVLRDRDESQVRHLKQLAERLSAQRSHPLSDAVRMWLDDPLDSGRQRDLLEACRGYV